jgi:type II secretory pathway predicted ATPase ExeA/phage tail protein X
MYEQFFGFSQRPFNVTPDPRFLFMTDSHQEALASLLYGIQERRGFISVSGEVGTGKTTLLNYLLTILDKKVKTIFIFNTHIPFEDLLKEILRNLALRAVDGTKISMIRKLNLYLLKTLEKNENVAILIDEAQNLTNEVLEELRMLSNMETGEAKLIQIVLVGQPELERKLNSQELRQLKQRIGIRRQIRPLTEEESRGYIDDRLQKMGGKTEDIFTAEALDLICRYSAGIFRNINIICDNAFLIAYALKKKPIDAGIVREVFGDMGIEVPRERIQTQKPYTAEQAIYNHYQKESVFQKLEALNEPQPSAEDPVPIASPRKRISASYLLAILAIGAFLYLAYLYFSYSPSSVRPNPTAKSAADRDRFQSPSPDFRPGSSGKVAASPAGLKKDKIPSSLKATSPAFPSNDVEINDLETAPLKVLTPEVPASGKEEGIGEPAGGAALLMKKAQIPQKAIEVSQGDTLFSLIERHYGKFDPTIVDYIVQLNAGIGNIHELQVNQKIIFPEVNEESLVIKSPDGKWKVHLGTFPSMEDVNYYKKEFSLKDKEIEVIERRVSPGEIWFRMVAGNFPSKQEGLKTLQELEKKGIRPVSKWKD